ncbi:hypothetical protein FHS18_003903 [Paenibacillus phyllosphaerae]|uniref:Uncharacterized protein n=1 Tax=Paenibacillus phyllosphaerae TaxID=274593 RepID=A0A7W5FP01_9BACL|nr:hypothetical protein [Paenibacillus phyllosphaerae]
MWEFMFTRSKYQTADMIEQHRLLMRICAKRIVCWKPAGPWARACWNASKCFAQGSLELGEKPMIHKGGVWQDGM